MSVNIAYPITIMDNEFQVFRLAPPVASEDVLVTDRFNGEKETALHEYVVVSTSEVAPSMWETAVMPSNAQGEVSEFIDLPGTTRGKVSTSQALEDLGNYVVK